MVLLIYSLYQHIIKQEEIVFNFNNLNMKVLYRNMIIDENVHTNLNIYEYKFELYGVYLGVLVNRIKMEPNECSYMTCRVSSCVLVSMCLFIYVFNYMCVYGNIYSLQRGQGYNR